MIAYGCDRCGQLYKRENGPRRCIEITHDMHPYGEYRLTLCDKCQRDLIKWLGSYVNGKKNIYDSDLMI